MKAGGFPPAFSLGLKNPLFSQVPASAGLSFLRLSGK
jgi:hypothetical protein